MSYKNVVVSKIMHCTNTHFNIWKVGILNFGLSKLYRQKKKITTYLAIHCRCRDLIFKFFFSFYLDLGEVPHYWRNDFWVALILRDGPANVVNPSALTL